MVQILIDPIESMRHDKRAFTDYYLKTVWALLH